MVAVVGADDLQFAINVLRQYGVKIPVYSQLEHNGQTYYVFEKAPAAALIKIQLTKGVDLNET